MYFCYMKKHRILSNEHKKYVKLSHMFKRIIDSEYPICMRISVFIHVYEICAFDVCKIVKKT